ncbi:hypothetical protein LXL04_004812 [Taraxacum kok-saghyz]
MPIVNTRIHAVSMDTWHKRLGHPSNKRITLLKDVLGFSKGLPESHHCSVCPLAKPKQLPFVSMHNLRDEPFSLIHCEVWGPFRVTSEQGFRYFVTIVDIRFRSDNTKELEFTDFFNEKGIIHQKSCVARPQQNSVVERKHQHLLNVARSLYFQSHLPIKYWTECVLTVAFLINRMPFEIFKDQTPFERLNGNVRLLYIENLWLPCVCFNFDYTTGQIQCSCQAMNLLGGTIIAIRVIVGYPFIPCFCPTANQKKKENGSSPFFPLDRLKAASNPPSSSLAATTKPSPPPAASEVAGNGRSHSWLSHMTHTDDWFLLLYETTTKSGTNPEP